MASHTRIRELSRRQIIQGAGAVGLTALGTAFAGPGLAAIPDDRRLVVILLRGGLDGLGLLAPVGDPNYANLRGRLALVSATRDGLNTIPLDDVFALNPAAGPLVRYWREGSLAFLPSVATPYTGRSHFEAQHMLETGMAASDGPTSGWLARALQTAGTSDAPSDGPGAISVDGPLPLILTGGPESAAWRPPTMSPPVRGLVEKASFLYRDDRTFASLLTDAVAHRQSAMLALGAGHRHAGRGPEGDAGSVASFTIMASLAGRTLARTPAPNAAVLQVAGWDTHRDQGGLDGILSRRLAGLAGGLASLAEAMAPVWDRTVIVVASEFGRTVTVNRGGGTDNGLGGLALVLGGAVNGGRIVGDWPGLGEEGLTEGGALRPTVDVRSVFKAVLRDHLGISKSRLDTTIFPDSGSAPALDGLITG